MTKTELEQTFTGPGFALTFLYYFALATLIVGIATMEVLHVGAKSALPYQYGIAFALPFGLINAWTKRSKTLSLTVKNRGSFNKKLKAVLSELNFELSGDPEIEDGTTYQTFRKPGVAGWLAGEIYVAIAGNEAVISSRSSLIKKLEPKL